MTDNLFNPEAFEQMPGQIAMKDVDETAKVGTRVSYEDMANPRRYGVVCDIRTDRWGTFFDIAWEDGHISTTDLRQCGWRAEL